VIKRFAILIISAMLGLSVVALVSGCTTETYVPEGKTPQVNTPTIGEEGVLRVGVDANNSPFAGIPTDSSNNEVIGLNVDIAAAIADEMGLKVRIIDIGDQPDAALAEGKVDIVLGVDKTDPAITCWRSEAYIQSGVALFAISADAGVPKREATPTIGAQSSSMSAWEVNKQFGEEALKSSPDLKQAFVSLSSGAVNYVAADAVKGTYAAFRSDPRVEVNIVALMLRPGGYSVGVVDSNTELKQLVSDTLVKLTSNGVINLIETKWVGKVIDLSSTPFTEAASAADAAEQEKALAEEAKTEEEPKPEEDEGN